jgi:signal transduction histidine kinase
VSLGVSLVLLVVLAPFNWQQYNLHRREAIAELTQLAATTGAVAVHSMEGAMLSNNRPAIQTIVDGMAQASDVSAVYLLNPRAMVAASPQGRSNGEVLDRNSPVCQECHRFPAESRPKSIVITAPGSPAVFRTMTPILNQPACVTCHPADERLNGVLYIDFSMSGLNERLDRGVRTALLTSAAIIVFSGLAIYALLSWLVITPVRRLADVLRLFSLGDRKTRAVVRSRDEIGLLGAGFNEMAATIEAQEATAGQLYAELESRDALRRQLLDRITAEREDDRRHLARELHDELGQLLTGLSLHLKLGQQAIPDDPSRAIEHLARANSLIGETIDESHRLIADLRPTVLDDYGLIPALREELSHRLTPLGIETELCVEEDNASLPPDIATAAFRIAQEAITNAIRHANPRRVTISLQQAAGNLTMTIEDDGVGLPHAQPGESGHALGILGMQERAEALGGHVEIGPRMPSGTRVVVRLPLEGGAP